MTFEGILDQILDMLQRRGRVTYGALKRQFNLDDAYLVDLKNEVIEGQQLAIDENGRVLVWTGPIVSTVPASPLMMAQEQSPLAYTPATPDGKDSRLPRRHGRRAQAGDGAVCRPQRLHRADRRP